MMALDIRLDFISNISPEVEFEMTRLRRAFIEIDNRLKIMSDQIEEMQKPAAQRTVALARTNLEISLQYAIKSLCIMGERNP
jgi:hypothetical protein